MSRPRKSHFHLVSPFEGQVTESFKGTLNVEPVPGEDKAFRGVVIFKDPIYPGFGNETYRDALILGTVFLNFMKQNSWVVHPGESVKGEVVFAEGEPPTVISMQHGTLVM